MSPLLFSAPLFLLLPNVAWTISVAGDCRNAINSNGRFDMAQATLVMAGEPGALQNLEAMSRDIGPSRLGLDRTRAGHFPIRTLRIGPNATRVRLADSLDNDGQGQGAPEAVYVDTLQIDAGATLDNAACKVYYKTLANNGSVTTPTNLVRINGFDTDGDGDVDLQDFLRLTACFNGPNRAPATTGCDGMDTEPDGDVDLDDFIRFTRCFNGPNNAPACE